MGFDKGDAEDLATDASTEQYVALHPPKNPAPMPAALIVASAATRRGAWESNEDTTPR